MGNIFEQETDPRGRKSQDVDPTERSLFSVTELAQIEATRQKLIQPENAESIFPSKLLLHAMKTHSVLSTSAQFENFIGTCTRSNKSTTLLCIWDLLIEKKESTQSSSSQLYRLLSIALELCGVSQLQSSLLITRLSHSIHKQKTERTSNQSSGYGSKQEVTSSTSFSQDDFESLQQWIRQYGPNLPNVFETFFNALCFGPSHGSSLTRFATPKLSIQSEVVSVSELLPLALYHSMLQGAWRRLYSSSSDGLSFNRIAHHIIGYEVFTY